LNLKHNFHFPCTHKVLTGFVIREVCANMLYTTHSSYLLCRNGTYYYNRRIPIDIRHIYPSSRIVLSLRTRSKAVATRGANSLTAKLEDYWSSIRVQSIAEKMLPTVSHTESKPQGLTSQMQHLSTLHSKA
jgi:hypothetical protein